MIIESDILDIFVINEKIGSSQFESLLGTYSLMLEHAVKQEHNWECQPNLLTNKLCILSEWIEAGLMTGSYPWAKDVVGRMLKMELITSTSKACPHKHRSLLHAVFEFKDVCQDYGIVLPSDKGQAGESNAVDLQVLLNPRGFFSSSSFADSAGKRLAALAPNKMEANNSLTNQFRELEAKLIGFLVEHKGYCYHKHGYKIYFRSDFLTRLIDLEREKAGLATRQQKLWKNIKKARCELEEMDQDEVTEERLSKCRCLSLLIDALFKEYGYVKKPKLDTSKELIDFFNQHVIFYLFDTNVGPICLKYGISLLLSQVVKDCQLNPIFSSIEQRMEQNYLSIETDVLYRLINDGSFEQSPLEKLLDYLPNMLIAEQPVQSEHNLSLLLSELSSWFEVYTSLDIGDLPAYQKQMNHVLKCISQQNLPKVVEQSLGLPTQRFSETLLDSRLKAELLTSLTDLSESLRQSQSQLKL